MVLTPAQYKDLAIKQLGGDTPDGLLASQVDLVWESHAGKRVDLRFISTKLDLLDALIGAYRTSVSFSSSGDLSVQENQVFLNLLSMKKQLEEDFTKSSRRRGARGSIGTIERVSPIGPPYPEVPDANDTAYKGDPYKRTRQSQ